VNQQVEVEFEYLFFARFLLLVGLFFCFCFFFVLFRAWSFLCWLIRLSCLWPYSWSFTLLFLVFLLLFVDSSPFSSAFYLILTVILVRSAAIFTSLQRSSFSRLTFFFDLLRFSFWFSFLWSEMERRRERERQKERKKYIAGAMLALQAIHDVLIDFHIWIAKLKC